MRNGRLVKTLDQGFTLVELLIYMAFAVVVLTLVGGMLINALNAEKTIAARSEATTSGQAVAQSVHSGVRNATHVNLLLTGTGADQRLVVQSWERGGEDAVATCIRWSYRASNGGAVYYQRGPIGSATANPEAEDYDGWLLLASGVQVDEFAQGIFQLDLAGGQARVGLSFSTSVGNDQAPVLIESTTTTRDQSTEPTECSS